MVQPTDMIGPAAQFIANSNPLQGVGRAAQQAGGIANQMAIAPGYMNILNGLGQGPSPTSNPSPIAAAMSALNAGGMGGMGGSPNNATIQPRGAPEALSAAMQPSRPPQQTYWAQLAAGFPRSGMGG